MTEVVYKIEENRPCARETFCLVLLGDTSAFTAPGQFANLLLPEFFLRRPISVCDVDEGRLTLVYKAVGEGTRALSCLERGDIITALAGLGNGFDISHTSGRPLLVGGGAGAAPMFGLARALAASGRRPRVILGFGSADEIF
ncbi:MAG: dihydroorotate dehydrogenase electron transfer subunit, partial [Oscillospiraceae bacterium]